MKQAIIVGGGPVSPEQLARELVARPDFLIAVDRGASLLRELGIIPDLLVGDMDSLDRIDLDRFLSARVPVERYPAAKDQSDMELALNRALDAGVRRIRIFGGLGGRLDHTLGNLGLLVKTLEQGAEASLVDETHEITAVRRMAALKAKPGWAVSLIPWTGRVTGVTTSGLKYPLHGETLYSTGTRGIHNQFTAATARVKLKDGILLVVCFLEGDSSSVLSGSEDRLPFD